MKKLSALTIAGLFFFLVTAPAKECAAKQHSNGSTASEIELAKILKINSQRKSITMFHVMAEIYSTDKVVVNGYYADLRDIGEKNAHADSKLVFQVQSKISSAEKAEFENSISYLKEFKYSDLKFNSTEKSEIFEYLDENGKVSMARTFDKEHGFEVRTIFFDKNGNARILQFNKELEGDRRDVSGKARVYQYGALKNNRKFRDANLELIAYTLFDVAQDSQEEAGDQHHDKR